MNAAENPFTGRLVPRFPAAQPSQACAEPAAPSVSSLDGAAFHHYTESSPLAAGPDQVRPAPAGRTIAVSDHGMILLRAIAVYEQRSNEDALVLALASHAGKIGLGPLARAALDEHERVAAGIAAQLAREHGADDLCDLPDFERRDRSRFSRAREAARDVLSRPAFALRASEGER